LVMPRISRMVLSITELSKSRATAQPADFRPYFTEGPACPEEPRNGAGLHEAADYFSSSALM
jgi:hypothetical protein